MYFCLALPLGAVVTEGVRVGEGERGAKRARGCVCVCAL